MVKVAKAKDINAYMIENYSINELNELSELLLDNEGNLKPVKAKDLKKVSQTSIAVWCHKKAIYSIVTEELIDWLKEHVKDKSAIEIGAGKNILGKELGIVQTDSYLQAEPEIMARYIEMRQPIIEYPNDVKKYDALKACSEFRPAVVISAWITQLGGPTIPQSSPYGINETKIVNWVDKYIMIGHEGNHGQKKILSLPHKVYEFPWLYSRTVDPGGNKIWVFE